MIKKMIKKNDKKIYPPLVTMSSIYFLIVLVIISLSRYSLKNGSVYKRKKDNILGLFKVKTNYT